MYDVGLIVIVLYLLFMMLFILKSKLYNLFHD